MVTGRSAQRPEAGREGLCCAPPASAEEELAASLAIGGRWVLALRKVLLAYPRPVSAPCVLLFRVPVVGAVAAEWRPGAGEHGDGLCVRHLGSPGAAPGIWHSPFCGVRAIWRPAAPSAFSTSFLLLNTRQLP